jgi:hypothetical protein
VNTVTPSRLLERSKEADFEMVVVFDDYIDVCYWYGDGEGRTRVCYSISDRERVIAFLDKHEIAYMP